MHKIRIKSNKIYNKLKKQSTHVQRCPSAFSGTVARRLARGRGETNLCEAKSGAQLRMAPQLTARPEDRI